MGWGYLPSLTLLRASAHFFFIDHRAVFLEHTKPPASLGLLVVVILLDCGIAGMKHHIRLGVEKLVENVYQPFPPACLSVGNDRRFPLGK